MWLYTSNIRLRKSDSEFFLAYFWTHRHKECQEIQTRNKFRLGRFSLDEWTKVLLLLSQKKSLQIAILSANETLFHTNFIQMMRFVFRSYNINIYIYISTLIWMNRELCKRHKFIYEFALMQIDQRVNSLFPMCFRWK